MAVDFAEPLDNHYFLLLDRPQHKVILRNGYGGRQQRRVIVVGTYRPG